MYSTSSFIEDDSDRQSSMCDKPQARTRKIAQTKYRETASTTSIPDSEVSQNTQSTERDDSKDNENPERVLYSRIMKAVYPTAPSYSMAGRNISRHTEYCSSSPNGFTERTPGPTYNLPEPSTCKPRAPHYSFGVRHSWRKALLNTEYED